VLYPPFVALLSGEKLPPAAGSRGASPQAPARLGLVESSVRHSPHLSLPSLFLCLPAYPLALLSLALTSLRTASEGEEAGQEGVGRMSSGRPWGGRGSPFQLSAVIRRQA